jgi:ATPase subunit of ABC transporter with duplicated ATPase domains
MIAASNVTMRFGKRILFEDVSVKFRPGNRYGLIGANGAGKSTFMRIMTGELESSSGEIAIDKGCRMGYLKQNHYEYDEVPIIDAVCMGNEKLWKIHTERDYLYSQSELSEEEEDRANHIEEEFGDAGGYTMETEAAKLLIGLGFPEEKHYDLMSTLTGGFKLRVLLAQVLFDNPDILLLDEPTNHLDLESIDWLCDTLKKHEGTVIVISHNRYFLNQVCTNIADLDYSTVRLFTGNYDDFMIANQIALESIQNENRKKEKRVNELKDFINRFSANASKAKQATSRQKELSKIEMETIKASSRVSPYIRFENKERLGEKVIEAESIAKTFDTTLFSKVDLSISNNDKVAIIGTNGAGKTTLLRLLIKALEPSEGKVIHGTTVQTSYFPQDTADMIKNPDQRAIEWLAQFGPKEGMSETEIRSFMGKMLFRGEDVNKLVKVLSGGEKARLIISKMMLEGGNVLVLDEPTNHLDLESIEALNYALSLVKNTVIFVSHDREFINSLATRIIAIEDGEVINFPGTFEEYEAQKKATKKRQK